MNSCNPQKKIVKLDFGIEAQTRKTQTGIGLNQHALYFVQRSCPAFAVSAGTWDPWATGKDCALEYPGAQLPYPDGMKYAPPRKTSFEDLHFQFF